MPPPPQPHASAGAGGQPSPTAKVPARYIIRNGLLIDRSASRQGDAKRIPISHRSDGPSPGGGARRLSPLHSPSDEQASSISVGSTHMAVERSAVVPTALPVSELPDEFHIYSAHREGRAFNLTSAAAALSGQPVGSPPPDGVPRYRIFPSMNPSSRQEAILLNDVLEKMLGRSNSSWEQQFHVYDLVLSEVVRQVWVNCSERGELLGKIRRAYARTVRAAAQRINQLEGAVRSLREELAMTDLAAAQRIAASQALTLDQQHEARKTALLTRMRAQYRHAMQGLHHGIDAFTRLSDGDRVRLMHVLACTKLERYQAAILVQALLETLPPAEATRAVRDYIDESVSSLDVVKLCLPPKLHQPVLTSLVAMLIGAEPRADGPSARQKDSQGQPDSHGALEHEPPIRLHLEEVLAQCEAHTPGSSSTHLAAVVRMLDRPTREAIVARMGELTTEYLDAAAAAAAAAASVAAGAPAAQGGPDSPSGGAPSAAAPAASEQPFSEFDDFDSASAPAAAPAGAADVDVSGRPRRLLHSIGAFAQSGMLNVKGKTVDEIADGVLRTGAILTLEQTLRACGEMLIARQEANRADDRSHTSRSSLSNFVDYWAFQMHGVRSKAREWLASLAASIHHHATYTDHPRVQVVALALGVGDSVLLKAADEELDEEAVYSEPPRFRARLFGFFLHVLEELLSTPEQVRAYFGTTEPVHIACDTKQHGAATVQIGADEQGVAVDAMEVLASLTELNELHFDVTESLIERMRPKLEPMPVGSGAFSGVSLRLDEVLAEVLALYAELENERKGRLQMLFKKHDENGDGVLDFAEFRSLALDFNPHFAPRDVAELFVEVLDESETRRTRGIAETSDGTGDDADSEDVVSAEAFADVVERFSVRMFLATGVTSVGGPRLDM